MLISADRFLDIPVMSLQTGSELARTSREIINPKNLSIIAYELEGRLLDQHPSLLRIDDVITIKEIYEINFILKDKLVIDEKNKKIGKVIGYTLAAGNFIIQQLRIRRPFLKSFGDTELLIHRSQIIKVTDDKIVVKSATISHIAEKTPIPQINSYENPFRKQPRPQPESTKVD